MIDGQDGGIEIIIGSHGIIFTLVVIVAIVLMRKLRAAT